MKRLTIGRDAKTGHVKTATHKWICFDRLAAYEDILFTPDGTERVTLDRLKELVEADADKRCIITDKQIVMEAVKRAILFNSDKTKYRYELGKSCLDACCTDAYLYLIDASQKGGPA